MNTPQTPDYGEPWNEQTATMNKGVHWLNTEQFNRAVACVNAMAGMADPSAEIEAMREAIKEAYISLEWATRTMNPPFEWEPFTRANAALAKLQPFIKP